VLHGRPYHPLELMTMLCHFQQPTLASADVLCIISSASIVCIGSWPASKQVPVFWNMVPCSLVEANKQAVYTLLAWLFAWFALEPWRWRRRVLPKRWLTFNGTRHYMPEDRSLHDHRCENLTSSVRHFCEFKPKLDFIKRMKLSLCLSNEAYIATRMGEWMYRSTFSWPWH
jgi:hypothetical protein